MKIAVLGGGVAGLSCALALRDRGHDPVVLERESEAGGKVRTTRVGEWLVEQGPAGVLDNAPATRELYKRLAIESQVIVSDDAARHRFVLRNGRLREVPDGPPKILLSRALPLGAKWRLFREPAAPPAPGTDETVDAFARRRLGARIADGLVEPMVSGIFAGDTKKLSIQSAFPMIVELEREHGSLVRGLIAREKARKGPRVPARLTTLQGGMGALSAALVAALGASLRTGAPALAVEKRGAGWTVRTTGGPVEVDALVLALPPDEAAPLVRPLDAAMADAFAAIPVAGVAAVSLGYQRAEVRHPLRGFGFLAPRLERMRMLGALWMSSTFPDGGQAPADHVLLRCMLGGAHDPAALDLSDGELVMIAREGLAAALGLAAAPRFSHVVRWRRGLPQYEVGHADRVATIDARAAALGLHVTGAALRGVGVNDVIRDARALGERIR